MKQLIVLSILAVVVVLTIGCNATSPLSPTTITTNVADVPPQVRYNFTSTTIVQGVKCMLTTGEFDTTGTGKAAEWYYITGDDGMSKVTAYTSVAAGTTYYAKVKVLTNNVAPYNDQWRNPTVPASSTWTAALPGGNGLIGTLENNKRYTIYVYFRAPWPNSISNVIVQD